MSVIIPNQPTTIKCKHCQSEAILKYGTYKGTQMYWCKSCKRKFKADSASFHMKKPSDYVSTALTMYYTGSSITDIRSFLKDHYGYYPSKHIVFQWVDKYTAIASKQFQDVKPKLGDIWVADETVLELDKGVKVWFFDIIDSDTRYLIASRASLSRTQRDAQLLIDRAIKRAGKSPKIVITDKLASYLDINYGKDTEHYQGGPFKFKTDNESTSQIERFHGTIKDRTKVMRAFRDLETLHTFMDGYLTYYNFFKNHESLGKTPAEAAGIEYNIKNWKDLCQMPVNHKTKTEPVKSEIADKPTSFEMIQPKIRTSRRVPSITPKTPRITQRHQS